jgi:hypothetical protein
MTHYLTHFKPNETHYLNVRLMPYFKWGKWGTIYIDLNWRFWTLMYLLHLTDWQYPRILTTVLDDKEE